MPDKVVQPAGRVRAYQISPGGLWRPRTDFRPNAVLYDWATIAAKLLSGGDPRYRIAGMYIEFANVGGAGDTVPPPEFTRADGIDYYNAMSGDSSDFLRVPLVATRITSTDPDKFSQGNRMSFFAQTVAVQATGVKGRPFPAPSGASKVYGGALVAIPDPADRTQDLVFSRFYFNPADQQVKLATGQIGLEWEITLE